MVRWMVVLALAGYLSAQGTAPPLQNPVAAPSQASGQESKSAAGDVDNGFPFNKFKEFSAIMIGGLLVGDQTEVHIYRSNNMLRTETGEGPNYFLTDLSTLQSYGFSLTGCMHDSHPYMRAFPFTANRRDRKLERATREKETIDGHECQVEDVTLTGGGLPGPMQMRFWEAEDLQGFPIKVEILKGPHSVVRYKNVVLGSPDPTLFLLPNSCNKTVPEFSDKKPSKKKKKAAGTSGSPK